METLDELYPIAAGHSDSGRDSAVELMSVVVLKKKNYIQYPNNFLPDWTKDERLKFQALTVEMLEWQNKLHLLRIPSEAELKEAGYLFSWLFKAPIVDSPRFLQRMLDDIMRHPLINEVNLKRDPFVSLQEIVDEAKQMGYDAVVNCTGLGSSGLCDDKSLISGRGALMMYDRNCHRRIDTHGAQSYPNDAVIIAEDPPWGSETLPCYLIPRGDTLVIGGTYMEGDLEPTLRPQERKWLKRNALLLGIDTNQSKSIAEWVGFRPIRPSIELSIDKTYGVHEGIPVIHNYGHGGSGWTTFVGTAKEAADLVENRK